MKQCQRCGLWGEIEKHHKVPKGMGAGKGYDFPANFVNLCHGCHQGNKDSAHRDSHYALRLKLEVQRDLEHLLVATHYLPEDLVKLISIPRKQSHKVVRPLFLDGGGYRREDVIRQLLGGKLRERVPADAG